MAMQCLGVFAVALLGHFFGQQEFELGRFFGVLERLDEEKIYGYGQFFDGMQVDQTCSYSVDAELIGCIFADKLLQIF